MYLTSCGELPIDRVQCPHCGDDLKLYMPVMELGYAGPVAVCRNNACGYYVRSFEHTKKTMGIGLGYRYGWSFKDSSYHPVSITMSDNPTAFFPCPGEWEDAINMWNEAVILWETQKEIYASQMDDIMRELEIDMEVD